MDPKFYTEIQRTNYNKDTLRQEQDERSLTLPDIKTYCKAAEGVSGSGLTTLETVWHCFSQ